MKFSIQITYIAEQDLLEIQHYISQVLQTDAKPQLLRLKTAILNLQHLPFRNPLVGIVEFAKQEIRYLPVDNYLIFYQIKDDQVFILRVLYAKREWKLLL